MLLSNFFPFLKKKLWSNRYRLALSPSCSKTTRCFSPAGLWYLIIKLPPIRALGEVIYFAYVKEGVKLCEPFPYPWWNFIQRNPGPTDRKRDTKGLSETRALETRLAWSRLPCQSRGSLRNARRFLPHPPLHFLLPLPSSLHRLAGGLGTTSSLFTIEKTQHVQNYLSWRGYPSVGAGGGDGGGHKPMT